MKENQKIHRLWGLFGKYGKAPGYNINIQISLHFYTPTTNGCHRKWYLKHNKILKDLGIIITRSYVKPIYKKL